MSSESPATMACRVLVMLFFVVVIPAVALIGTPVTSWLQKVIEHQFGIEFGASHQVDSVEPATKAAEALVASPLPRDQTPGLAVNEGPAGVVHASHVILSQQGGGQSISAESEKQQSVNPRAIDSMTDSEPFAQFHAQLRRLGSVHSQLETWGSQGQLYRFQCRVSMNGSQNLTRCFEARDPNPLQAMAKVVRQVEEWRQAP